MSDAGKTNQARLLSMLHRLLQQHSEQGHHAAVIEPPWRRQSPPARFDDLEQALELELHPDIAVLYGGHFGPDLPLWWHSLPLTLIQCEDEHDLCRLQQNLIGHVLMQRRLKLADTLFIASVPHDNFVISLVNQTGEIVLEQLGRGPIKRLARDLGTFLDEVGPRTANTGCR